MQDLDEARHVRALKVMGQVHIHIERGHGVLLAGRAILHLDRVADVLDANPINGDLARIGASLYILDQ